MHHLRPLGIATSLAALCLAAPVLAEQEDAGAAVPTFQEGDTIQYEGLDKIRPFLPKAFWDNRDFFFYEGMQLEVGPFQADYSPPPEYHAASQRFLGQARIGPDGSLENHTAGQPFAEEIDCTGDPNAGRKHIWNFDYRWRGGGGSSQFFYSYWDRGERLPLYYVGTGEGIALAHRPEAQYLKTDGDIFRGEKRKGAAGIQVDDPYDARGILLLSYRYKVADGPRVDAQNDDTWVYVPSMRRVRRISTAQRTDAVSGTDFTLDDLFSFNGIIPQYDWECIAEMKLIAPMNTKVLAYPYTKDHNFGPYGLSYASDRWELRDAVMLRMKPKNADHPYHHKDIYLDKQTLKPMYSVAYDQKQELWKIITHNHRWSGDDSLEPNWYEGWKGIEIPRDLVVVSDTIANVQTGTGNRIEFWDRTGVPFKSKGLIRRFIDVGRLTRGR